MTYTLLGPGEDICQLEYLEYEQLTWLRKEQVEMNETVCGVKNLGQLLKEKLGGTVQREEKKYNQRVFRERNTMRPNYSSLIKLAEPELSRMMKDFNVVSDSIEAAAFKKELEEQMAQERANAIKNSVREVISLGKFKNDQDQRDVQELRRIRQQEKAIKDRLANRQRAWDFGNATMNYLPVAHSLGLLCYDEWSSVDASLLKVPEDFKKAE